MRLHQVALSEGGKVVGFARSVDNALDVRQRLIEDIGYRKKDLVIAPVEVPTDKTGLVDFLSRLVDPASAK